jgi:hypothetical protein
MDGDAFILTNAPTTFMRLINDIFQAHLGKIVVIYLDDILVFSKTRRIIFSMCALC